MNNDFEFEATPSAVDGFKANVQQCVFSRAEPPPRAPVETPRRRKVKRRGRSAPRSKRAESVEAKPLPWVPSSDGGVSFNLAAACNYALRKTQQPVPN